MISLSSPTFGIRYSEHRLNSLKLNFWFSSFFDHEDRVKSVYQSGLDERLDEIISYLKAGNLSSCTRLALEKNREPVIFEPSQTCASCPLYPDHQGKYALTMRLEHAGEAGAGTDHAARRY